MRYSARPAASNRCEGRADLPSPRSLSPQLPLEKYMATRSQTRREASRNLLDDRFHETSFDEANRRGTGSMLVDSLFEKSRQGGEIWQKGGSAGGGGRTC